MTMTRGEILEEYNYLLEHEGVYPDVDRVIVSTADSLDIEADLVVKVLADFESFMQKVVDSNESN